MRKHNYPKTRKPGSGGARPGAGAPKKDPTTTLAYRVPAAIAEPLDKRIREVISIFKDEGPKLYTFPPGTTVKATPAEELEKVDPADPLPDISRAVVSAYLDKEDKAISKIIKKKKKNE